MKDKKVIYLSHPYRGKTDTEEEKRHNVKCVDIIMQYLTVNENDLIVISPVHSFLCLEGIVSGEFIMNKCFSLLAICDEIWVYGDWENSDGCKQEINFANESDIPIRFMS